MVSVSDRVKLSGLIVLITVAALVILSVTHVAGFASGENGAPLPENNEGLTYGSMLEAEMNGTEMPDLVSCIAANGKRGYMYYEEYAAIAERDYELSSNELNSIMSDRVEKIAKVFAESANDYYGCELLSIAEVRTALDLTTSVNGTEAAISLLEGEVRAAVLSNKTVSGDQIVYGGSPTDAIKVIQSQRVSSINEVVDDASFDESTNAPCANSLLASEAFASNYMNTMEYSFFYQKAKEAVGVTLPVYEKDGETVIGEIVIDSL